MKPDVVFFGDNVPKPVVQDTFDRVEKSDGVMILGTYQADSHSCCLTLLVVDSSD